MRRDLYCLARVYLDLAACAESPSSILQLLITACSASAVTAELNYGAQRSIKAVEARLENLTWNEVEELLAIDQQGEVAFAIAKEFDAVGSCASLVACWPAAQAYGAPQSFFAQLDRGSQVAYGYAWTAPPDVSPVTETRIRKRWFGQSVRVPKRREGWLSPSQSLLAGGLRGIYPLNYWRPPVHAQLAALGVHLPPNLAGSTGLVEVDAASARSIRSLNPASADWLRCDA